MSILILVSDSKTDSSSSIFSWFCYLFSHKSEAWRIGSSNILEITRFERSLLLAFFTSCILNALEIYLASYTTYLFLYQPPGQRLNRYPLNKDYMAIENIYVIYSAFF